MQSLSIGQNVLVHYEVANSLHGLDAQKLEAVVVGEIDAVHAGYVEVQTTNYIVGWYGTGKALFAPLHAIVVPPIETAPIVNPDQLSFGISYKRTIAGSVVAVEFESVNEDEDEDEAGFVCDNCSDKHDSQWDIRGEYCTTCAAHCERCNDTVPNDDAHYLSTTEETVCESCYDDAHFTCDCCGDSFENGSERDHTTQPVSVGNDEICGRCIQNDYAYCDGCNEYVSMDNYHSDGYCVDCHSGENHSSCSPTSERINLLGVRNDQRFTVAIKENDISNAGMIEIDAMLKKCQLPAMDWANVGTDFRTLDGTFARRAARFYKKSHGIKLECERFAFTKRKAVLSEDGTAKRNDGGEIIFQEIPTTVTVLEHLGNIASTHSVKTAVSYECELTRDLNKPAEEYANAGSCWFESSYGSGMCQFKANYGFAFRTFGSYDVNGRAWVLPLYFDQESKEFEVCGDDGKTNAFIVFNGYLPCYYGDETVALATAFAAFAKMPFKAASWNEGNMYNNGKSYLVASTEVLSHIDDDDILNFTLDRAHCYCG